MGKLHESEVPKPSIKDTFNRALSKVIITPENIPFLAYPIVNFIHQEKPDYIISFDRGARILALATHMLYREMYGEMPTRDKKINFRKVSRKVSNQELRRQFRDDIERMLEHTDSPTVLLLDDWVLTGKTKKLSMDLISEFSGGKVKILFGVMRGRGKGADISGDKNNFAYYAWRNNTNLLGIDYDDKLQAQVVYSPSSISYRRRIVHSVRRFSERIGMNTQEQPSIAIPIEVFPKSIQ